MINIERSFGTAKATFLKKLPCVVNCLEELNTAGARIVVVPGDVGSWDPRTKFLRIGDKCSRSLVAITLMHENHHRKEPTGVPAFKKTRRGQWVQRQMNIEVNAIMAEFAVIDEIRSLGGKLSKRELEWYRLYKRGGRKAMLKRMKETRTSNTFELYPEYYGVMFDDLLRDHEQCCGSKTATCKQGVDHFANIERRMAYIRRRNREVLFDDWE